MAKPLDPRLLNRATATRKFLVAVVLTGLCTAVLVILQAWLIAQAVGGSFDRHHAGLTGLLPELPIYIAGLLVVFAGRALLNWLNSWLAHRASADVKSQLRRDVMAARLARPGDSSTSSATLMHIVGPGLDALDGYFSKYLPQLILSMVVPLLIGAVVLITDWRSAIIAAFTIPLIPIFMALIGWKTQEAVDKRLAVQTRLTNHFSDLVLGLPTLQVFGRARAQLAGVKQTEDANRRVTMRTLMIAFISGGVLEFLATLSVALIAVTVGFRVVAGHLDLTTSLFLLVLAPEIYLPLRMVGVHFHDSADGQAAADAAFNFIDAAGAGAFGGDATAPDVARSAFIFDDVSVQYPGAESASLQDFSARLEPGEVTALVGKSGGGKTTALAVLLGFQAPTSGQIWLENRGGGRCAFEELDLDSWRSQLAYVAQEPGMLAGTIADNLRVGFPNASDAQLRDALDRAGGQWLALDRHVGDEAEGLSAGERRRVALARALLRIELGGAKLLVLDEPTAGLDAETEAVAIQAVRDSGAGAVIVTHRPALIELADQVVEI